MKSEIKCESASKCPGASSSLVLTFGPGPARGPGSECGAAGERKPHLLLTPAGYEGDLLLGVVVDGPGDGLQPLVALRGRAGRQDEGSLHALDVQLVLVGLLARLAHLQEGDNKEGKSHDSGPD